METLDFAQMLDVLGKEHHVRIHLVAPQYSGLLEESQKALWESRKQAVSYLEGVREFVFRRFATSMRFLSCRSYRNDVLKMMRTSEEMLDPSTSSYCVGYSMGTIVSIIHFASSPFPLTRLFTLGSPASWFIHNKDAVLPTVPWTNVAYRFDPCAGPLRGIFKDTLEPIQDVIIYSIFPFTACFDGSYLKDSQVHQLLAEGLFQEKREEGGYNLNIGTTIGWRINKSTFFLGLGIVGLGLLLRR